jgi:hypothetical protein
VPVPAHPRRNRRHGFNQAAALARAISRAAGLPVVDLLRREGASAPQVGLERRARLANARGSVRVVAQVPPAVVLVDDVYTTGATIDACARVLRDAGATEVMALTFARAMRPREPRRQGRPAPDLSRAGEGAGSRRSPETGPADWKTPHRGVALGTTPGNGATKEGGRSENRDQRA